MKKLALGAIGVLSAAAVIVAPASAAYKSPTLSVSQGAAKTTTGPAPTTISIATSSDDDATARAVIYAPPDTVKLNQAAGTKLGSVRAEIVALALGSAALPLTGQVEVRAADGTYRAAGLSMSIAAAATRCTGTALHAAFWVLVLSAAGQTLEVPMFVDRAAGTETGFSSAKITVCLPPPDIPVDAGGAPLGAKLTRAEFSISGVFAPTEGVWFGLLTPYTPGSGEINHGGSVYSPAAVAFASATIKAAKFGKAKRVTGQLIQGGVGVGGLKVEIWGGVNRTALKRIAVVTTKRDGTYSLTTRSTVTTFQARVTVLSREAPKVCQIQNPLSVPCVNPTVNGFSIRSGTSRA